jgi:uncharacterized DUF497 family protein
MSRNAARISKNMASISMMSARFSKFAHVVVPSAYHGDEERFLAIGLFEGRFVTVVYTTRSEAVRVISFRRARYEERQKYQEVLGGRA